MANKNNNKQKSSFNFTWVYMIILVVLGYLFITGEGESLKPSSTKEVSYTEFQNCVRKGYGKELLANKD